MCGAGEDYVCLTGLGDLGAEENEAAELVDGLVPEDLELVRRAAEEQVSFHEIFVGGVRESSKRVDVVLCRECS